MEVISERKEKIIYRDGENAVKLFSKKFPKSDILNEALNQSRVEETGLPIPALKSVSVINGQWAITMEYVEGKTLAEIMHDDPDNLEKYMNEFIDLQMLVHSKKSPLLNKLKDKMQRKISSLTIIDATTRYELHTRLESMPKHDKVCHGDFNPSNIIIDSDGNPHIIDWSHATQGNAAADAARTYLLFALHTDKKTADLYLDMFCKKTDTAKQYIQQWLPIVAASQLVKRIEGEEDFLKSWIDVVDYS